jgi:REP element-mobilizing transposase RayT
MSESVVQRRSIRLCGYDYSRQGAYFVTVCTEGRKRLFGTVVNGRMALNDAGRAAAACWRDIPNHFPHAAVDEWVVMPDHVHGIIVITRDGYPVGANNHSPVLANNHSPVPANNHSPVPANNHSPALGQERAKDFSPLPCGTSRTVGSIVRGFKIGVTKWVRGDSPWQRNYYEIIVRNETALANIRMYIRDNPANWDVLRYGEPRFAVGNRSLLALPQTAFLASRGGKAASVAPTFPTPPACVMSGFLSPLERAVSDACLADGTPMVQILARGLPETFFPRVQRAIAAGRLLVITPFPATETRVSAQRAAWCNQYVLHAAERVVIGQLSADGMLACLLADLPHDKPISILGNRIMEGGRDESEKR